MPQCSNFQYQILRKRVKRISIRVTKEQEVIVTVPLRGSLGQAEEFVRSKQDWIEEKLLKMQSKIPLHVDEQQWTAGKEAYLTEIVTRVYPGFASYGIPFPTLRFRKMVSRYGTCRKTGCVVTLNKILADMPFPCAEYVAAHELAHLVEANHGREFYRVLETVMPDYKQREERLSEYALYH